MCTACTFPNVFLQTKYRHNSRQRTNFLHLTVVKGWLSSRENAKLFICARHRLVTPSCSTKPPRLVVTRAITMHVQSFLLGPTQTVQLLQRALLATFKRLIDSHSLSLYLHCSYNCHRVFHNQVVALIYMKRYHRSLQLHQCLRLFISMSHTAQFYRLNQPFRCFI